MFYNSNYETLSECKIDEKQSDLSSVCSNISMQCGVQIFLRKAIKRSFVFE